MGDPGYTSVHRRMITVYYVPGDDGAGSYGLFSMERGDLSVIRLAPDWKSPCGAAEMADGVGEWNEAAVCAPSVTA